jgi:hypothetical protein
VAYDAKRQRVVFTTLWHTGFHFTFAPATMEWRVFPVERTEGGLHAVAYDPTAGVIYGLGRDGELRVFDSDLNPVRTVALTPPPRVPTNRPDSDPLQLVMAGDHLVLCSDPEGGVRGRMRAAIGHTQPGFPSSGTASGKRSDLPVPPCCFWIDPGKGVVRLIRFGSSSHAP